MARTQRRFMVDFASLVTRVHLRILSDKGALRHEFTLSLEEFNQLCADCDDLRERIRGPLVVTSARGEGP